MSETDSPQPEPPRLPPPPVPPRAAPAPPRRLYRDPQGPLGGVASGMAAYFEIDPVIVRLMWIVALLTGVGFFAYLVSWVVIPKAKGWPPPGYAQPVAHETRSAALLSGLVIVGLAALIGKGVDGMGDLLLPAALIGFGVYLLNQRASSPDAPPAAGVSAAGPAGEAASPPGDAWPGDASASAEPYAAPPAAAAAAPGSLVTPTVLSLLAIAAGVCWAFAAAGLLMPTVVGMASGALVLVGLGLLSSLWLGRAPGLPLLGVGLTGVLVVATAVEPWVQSAREFHAEHLGPLTFEQFSNGAGDRRFEPATLAELQPVYELGMGELTLDLAQLDFTGTTRDVQVELGMGKATVIVPNDVHVEVSGQVALGKAIAFDVVSEGIDAKLNANDPGLGAGTLRVKMSVGLGDGMVVRDE